MDGQGKPRVDDQANPIDIRSRRATKIDHALSDFLRLRWSTQWRCCFDKVLHWREFLAFSLMYSGVDPGRADGIDADAFTHGILRCGRVSVTMCRWTELCHLPVPFVIPNAACFEAMYATFPGTAAYESTDVTLMIVPRPRSLVAPNFVAKVRGSCFSMTLTAAREQSSMPRAFVAMTLS